MQIKFITSMQNLIIHARNILIPSLDICSSKQLTILTLKYIKFQSFHKCFADLKIYTISLECIEFTNDTLTKEVLVNLPKATIAIFKIMNCKLINIQDNTFDGFAFKNLQLNGNKIKIISNKIFNIVPTLRYLRLYN